MIPLHSIRSLLAPLASLLLSGGVTSARSDANLNGMDDSWESAWNGVPYPASFTAAADLDGDGLTNFTEFVFGTDPSRSTTGLLEISYTPAAYYTPEGGGDPVLLSPEAAELAFPTVPGRLYQVQVSEDLSAGSWIDLGDPLPGDGSPLGRTVILRQPDGTVPDKLFFRLSVKVTDADGNGIDDAWEAQYAATLISWERPAHEWGAVHSALVAGDLDPGHDYTGEGYPVAGHYQTAGGTATGTPADEVTWLSAFRYFSIHSEPPLKEGEEAPDPPEIRVIKNWHGAPRAGVPGDIVTAFKTETEADTFSAGSLDGKLAQEIPAAKIEPGPHSSGDPLPTAHSYHGIHENGSRDGQILATAFQLIRPKPESWPVRKTVYVFHTTGTPANPTFNGVEARTLIIPSHATRSNRIDVLPLATRDSYHRADIVEMEILPLPGQAGVIGDMIPDQDATSGRLHFVTPKLTPQIPNPNVALEYRIGRSSTLGWDFMAGVTVAGGNPDPDRLHGRLIPRNVPQRHEIELTHTATQTQLAKLNLWVLWSYVTPRYGQPEFVDLPAGNGKKYWLPTEPLKTAKFIFNVQPTLICDPLNAERPDLDRIYEFAPPGASQSHIFREGSADTATRKWDVSRQFKLTVKNPQMIPASQLPAVFTPEDPIETFVPVDFPDDDTAGNDDPMTGIDDEDVIPYRIRNDQNDLYSLNHIVSQITSADAPSIPIYDLAGGDGRVFAIHYDYYEFSRVELKEAQRKTGKFWFRISDLVPWHFHGKFKYNDLTGKWDDNGSSHGPGHNNN